MINNGVLAAQLVSFIPAQLSDLLDVDEDSILVLVIRDGSSSGNGGTHRRKRALVTTKSSDDAILVTVAIPSSSYYALRSLVKDQNSELYTPNDNSFGQFVDSSFPLSNTPPSPTSSKGSSGNRGNNNDPLAGDGFGSGDPNAVQPDDQSGQKGWSGTLIGLMVGLATAAYVGIAMVAVRMYRRKKLREQQEDQRNALQRSISAPISVQGSSQGWGWHG